MHRISTSYDPVNDSTTVRYSHGLPDGSEWHCERTKTGGDFRQDEAALALMDKNTAAIYQRHVEQI